MRAEQSQSGGVIVVTEEPLNLEMPFSRLDSFITPNECFYVRCHFPIPQVDRTSWRLKVEGAVASPLELNYDDLSRMETRATTATVECAGNSRSFLEPKVKGVQWGPGAVGNAEWSGVTLSEILARAGIMDSAVEVVLEGADHGTVKETPRPEGEIHYARSLPLKKATSDVLLALKMNGEALSASHGFPLRAIVPGWYGMASVKWLQRIIVTDKPFNGYYQSADYSYWERQNGLPTLVPLGEMLVKAQIANPLQGQEVPTGGRCLIHGAAWTGETEVTKVETSHDDGATWVAATLTGEAKPNAWRLWELEWVAPSEPGQYRIMARATDARGQSQPLHRNADRLTYMINHCVPVEVTVR